MPDYYEGTAFTENAWEAVYNAVDSRYFQDRDAEMIYEALEKELRSLSFGEHLRRYLYRSARLSEPFESVPLKVYQQIIRDAFSDTCTPPSFTPTTAKLSALSKNWLTQQAVSRRVVFLLGFGLAMSVEDINHFLTMALREQGINAKSPFEVICWYCRRFGYGYAKFDSLWRRYQAVPVGAASQDALFSEMTIGVRASLRSIDSDEALLAYVSRFKTDDSSPRLSVSARRQFDLLYARARELAAELYNREETEVMEGRSPRRVATAEDITESDLEHIISSAIPVDRHGNLTPGKASRLNAQFDGKRFSRQHISDILAGRSEVTRFDLITLNFFLFAQTPEAYPNAKARYVAFVESTNRILTECLLGELYIANPYESFVLMCILSEAPMSTYADVWELSYQPEES